MNGIGAVFGFADDFVVKNHYRVSGDDEPVGANNLPDRECFVAGDVDGNFGSWHTRGPGFGRIAGDDIKFDFGPFQELFSAGRTGGENDFLRGVHGSIRRMIERMPASITPLMTPLSRW